MKSDPLPLSSGRLLDLAGQEVLKHLGRPSLLKSDLWNLVLETEKTLTDRWYLSGCTDFGIYSEPDYLLTLLNSWSGPSKNSVNLLLKIPGIMTGIHSALDFHGGLGLTALNLAARMPHMLVRTHTVVQSHGDICLSLAAKFGIKNVEVVDHLAPADLLFAQETFEHFWDPCAELLSVLAVVQPRLYFDGTSFSIEGPGHFPRYKRPTDVAWDPQHALAKAPHPGGDKGAARGFNALLRDLNYERWWKLRGVKCPFNGHPRLWIRNPGEPPIDYA